MAFVLLDDQIAQHPKVLRAGAEAAWLWAVSIAYCSRQLTDGHVPGAALGTLGTFRSSTKKLAALLVEVRLFDADGADYRVHDYLRHNPDKATVQERLRLAADRKAAYRARKSHEDGPGPGRGRDAAVPDVSHRDKGETPASSRVHVPTPTPTPTPTKPKGDDDSAIEGQPGLRLVEAMASSSSTAHGSGPVHLAVLELVSVWNRMRSTSNCVDAAQLGRKARVELAEAVRTKSLDDWEATFRRVEASDYLAGRGDLPGLTLWKAIELAERIDAGQYDPKRDAAKADSDAMWARAMAKVGGPA